MNKILCSISTKGRYHTFLPLAIQSVINQTRKVDLLIIYDDNNEPIDVKSANQDSTKSIAMMDAIFPYLGSI